MKWISDNKEWIFSGVGVIVISSIIKAIFKGKKRKRLTQNQRSGKNSPTSADVVCWHVGSSSVPIIKCACMVIVNYLFAYGRNYHRPFSF